MNRFLQVITAGIIFFGVRAYANDAASAHDTNLVLVDKIEAIIFGDESTVVITKSDVEKMSLDGKPRTLPDILFETLVFMDAEKFKITADEAAVDRYIAMIMRENNLSQADISAMFKTAGYSYEEGRHQLGVMFAVNTMLDFKIKSRLVIPEADIIAYYHANPIIQEESYRLQRIMLPISIAESASDAAQLVERASALGKEISGANYSSVFTVKKSDLAADKMFIAELKQGAISKPVAVQGGFECFKLVEKKPASTIPLQERYREISDELKRPLFEKLFEEYRKSLFDAASIVYF